MVLGETSLEIRADRSRQLRALDPTGRQLAISCGSALTNALVTIAAAGGRALVERMPDAREPDLLARLTLGGPGNGCPAVHGVLQHAVTDPDQLLLAGRLDRLALLERAVDPARHAELRALRTQLPRAADGRFHDQDMVVLGTTSDTPLDWLRTGEALQHLVLESRPGLSVHPLPHLVENPRIRDELRGALGLDVHIQAVLLLGPPAAVAPSRNRRLVDVLCPAR